MQLLHDAGDSGALIEAYTADANEISSRIEDQDGRLFVGPSIITKVGIDDYLGREIANWQAIGLDPNRKYRFFRCPDELEKATPAIRNQPILSEHAPLTADNHKSDLTIGAVGSDPTFDGTCVKASLGVWRQPFIDRIKSGTQREISLAYRFRADMTPGTWRGKAYDGVMRNIKPNHVAIVPAGRVNLNGDGPIAAVADSAEGLINMAEKDDDKTVTVADEGAGTGSNPVPGEGVANDEGKEPEKKADEKKPEGTANDEGDKPGDGATSDKDKDKEGTAMDAAAITATITNNLRGQFRAAGVAREEVRPVVGVLSMAMDSADEIYGAALRQKGVDLKGVHPSAYAGMFKAMRPMWEQKKSGMAMDSATNSKTREAATRLGADRIRSVR